MCASKTWKEQSGCPGQVLSFGWCTFNLLKLSTGLNQSLFFDHNATQYLRPSNPKGGHGQIDAGEEHTPCNFAIFCARAGRPNQVISGLAVLVRQPDELFPSSNFTLSLHICHLMRTLFDIFVLSFAVYVLVPLLTLGHRQLNPSNSNECLNNTEQHWARGQSSTSF